MITRPVTCTLVLVATYAAAAESLPPTEFMHFGLDHLQGLSAVPLPNLLLTEPTSCWNSHAATRHCGTAAQLTWLMIPQGRLDGFTTGYHTSEARKSGP